jgi:hypothetical protein
VLPSGVKAISSPSPNGFDGVSATRLPVSGAPFPESFPSATAKPNSRDLTPGSAHVSQWRTKSWS